jgi:translation elongation factor EF-1alpha
MDVTEEERKSGCSQDVARVTIPYQDNLYTFLDCPGLPNYQSKVISGAAIADIAVLVLSAKKCEEKCCI